MKTESTSLTSLPQKKITTGLKRLQEAGLTPDRWLKMLDTQPADLKRLVAAWPGSPEAVTPQGNGLVYDAVAILGFGEASSEPLPKAAPGEVVIRVGAWSLQDLRTCETVTRDNLMWDQDWYNEYPWSRTKLTPGVYRLRLPLPDSNRKTFAEQRKLLLADEDVAPVALVAAALLCSLKQAGKDLLDGDWSRCAEPLPGGNRAGLLVDLGRVDVYDRWDDVRRDNLWLAASRNFLLANGIRTLSLSLSQQPRAIREGVCHDSLSST